MTGKPQRGVTTVELLSAVGVLLVLTAIALPLKHWDDKRRREDHLRMTLESLRGTLDQYKKMVDEGLIQQKDVDQRGYPTDLDELVDGVDVIDPTSGEKRKMYFLNRVPEDPFTGEAEWGLRSYQDDWDSDSWGGENVWDVYSLSEGKALDGTYYKDW